MTSQPLWLGVDVGLTQSKAVVFDGDGAVVASAARPTRNDTPREGWSEREPEGFWRGLAATIADAAAQAPGPITAVGIAAHGDGLWLVDDALRPTRAGITSLDQRAASHAESVARRMGGRGLEVIGKRPWPSHPAAILDWLREHDADALSSSTWAMSTKDYLVSRLTGAASTDLTDASATFLDMATQTASADALALQGLGELSRLATPIFAPDEVVGTISPDAAVLTGLPPGTPVVAGLHDTAAGAIGIGAFHPGDVSVLCGTISVNQQVVDDPLIDETWVLNSFYRKGLWIRDCSSLAASANVDWFLSELRDIPIDRREAVLADAASSAPGGRERPYFLPYINGSMDGSGRSAGLIGVHAADRAEDVLVAILEGLAINVRTHLARIDVVRPREIHVAGGVSRSPGWRRMLANLLGATVVSSATSESGALGAAIAAASGAGQHASIPDAAEAMLAPAVRTPPASDAAVALADARCARFTALDAALSPWWADSTLERGTTRKAG